MSVRAMWTGGGHVCHADGEGSVVRASDGCGDGVYGSSLKTFSLNVPTLGRSIEVHMRGEQTLADLRQTVTAVVSRAMGRDVRPRLLGLPPGHPGLRLAELKLKAPHRVVVVAGSLEVAVREGGGADLLCRRVNAEHQHVLREVDEDAVDWRDAKAFADRVALRVLKYRGAIQLAALDPRKKNLIIDIDYTILDTDVFNNTVLTPSHWRRPFVHDLLQAVQPHYNLCVWSATGNGHLWHKLHQAGLLSPPTIKLALLIDYGAMIRVCVRRGATRKEFNTKPLAVLYGLWPVMNPDNTIMVDDHRRSFIMNPNNGIHVNTYHGHQRAKDQEFRDLAKYMLMIKDLPSVRQVHHEYWREVAHGYIPLSATLVHKHKHQALPAITDSQHGGVPDTTAIPTSTPPAGSMTATWAGDDGEDGACSGDGEGVAHDSAVGGAAHNRVHAAVMMDRLDAVHDGYASDGILREVSRHDLSRPPAAWTRQRSKSLPHAHPTADGPDVVVASPPQWTPSHTRAYPSCSMDNSGAVAGMQQHVAQQHQSTPATPADATVTDAAPASASTTAQSAAPRHRSLVNGRLFRPIATFGACTASMLRAATGAGGSPGPGGGAGRV